MFRDLSFRGKLTEEKYGNFENDDCRWWDGEGSVCVARVTTGLNGKKSKLVKGEMGAQ